MTTSYRDLLLMVARPDPVLIDVDIPERVLAILQRRHPEWFKTLPSPPRGRQRAAKKKPEVARRAAPAAQPETRPASDESLFSIDQILPMVQPLIPDALAIEMAGRYAQVPGQPPPTVTEEDAVITPMGLEAWDGDEEGFSEAVDYEKVPEILVDDDQTIIIEDDDVITIPDEDAESDAREVVMIDSDEEVDVTDDVIEVAPPAGDASMLEIGEEYRPAVVDFFSKLEISRVTRVVQDVRWSPGIRREYYLLGSIRRAGADFYIYFVQSDVKSGPFGIFMSRIRADDDERGVGAYVSNLLLGLVINDNVQKLFERGLASGFGLKDINMKDAEAYEALKSIIKSGKRTTKLVRMARPWGAYVNGLGLEAGAIARHYQVGELEMLLGKALNSNAFFLTYVLDDDEWEEGVSQSELDIFGQTNLAFDKYPVLARATF